MADVFLSYARADKQKAEQVKAALEGAGLSVFFDVEGLDGGDVFPDVLDREVKTAGAVVSLWSPHALSRPWVKQECSIGLKRKCLIPLAIEPLGELDVPVAFEGLQQIDFIGFHGRTDSPEWLKLMRSLSRTLGRPELVAQVVPAPRAAAAPAGGQAPWPAWPKVVMGMAGAAAVIGLVGFGYNQFAPKVETPEETLEAAVETPAEVVADAPAEPADVQAAAPQPAGLTITGENDACPDFEARIYFDFDKTTLNMESLSVLEEAMTRTFDCQLVEVRIEAHEDLQSSPPYAQAVSERRAAAVADWLAGNGVSGEQVLQVGYGSTQPLAAGERSPANRRADVFFDVEVPAAPE